MARPYDARLRRIVLDETAATLTQVEATVRMAETERPPPPLEVLLVETGLLTHAQVAALFAAHAGQLSAGDPRVRDRAQLWGQAAQAVEKGWAGPQQVNRALREHARREDAGEPWRPLGQLMAELGLLKALGGAGVQAAAADQAPTTEMRRPTIRQSALPDGESPTLRVPRAAEAAVPAARTPPSPIRPRPLLADQPPAEPLFPGPRATGTQSKMLGRWIGPYWIEDELGRGGMGVVYKAQHVEKKITVALKILHARESASGQTAARFRQEAEAMSRLRHPGIVAVNDIGQASGYTFIAMEFVEGITLDRLLLAPERDSVVFEGAPERRVHALDPREAIAMIREVAEAVHAAHLAGVIHRDLKPSNVLRDAAGRLKVMDFGLAKVVDARERNLTRSGILLGTPPYMSPEMAEGKSCHVDARSDVYQLGAMLFEFLTGHPPYEGPAPIEIVMRIAAGEAPPAPRSLNPRLDHRAEAICLAAMAHDVDRRYPTARALAEDCARYLAGEPPQGAASSAHEAPSA